MDVKSIVTILLIAVVSMAFVGSASAATYYVNPGDSIQAAINGAADGDTIILNDGDYTENVVVNKSVAIISYGMYEYLEYSGVEIGGDWWIDWSGFHATMDYMYMWDYLYTYDGQVIVTAADPKLDVFRVASDDVLIMNVNLDYVDSGWGIYGDAGVYDWWNPLYGWWYAGVYQWYEEVHDNPMSITGAYKSDAAGVHVDGAANTVLFNLLISGCDEGIKLDHAIGTTISLCELPSNNREGILVLDSEDVYIVDTVVTDSGKRGIEADSCVDVELDHVAVIGSKKDGIDFAYVDGVFMVDVLVADGGKTGIKLDTCTDVELLDSLIEDNGRNGLTMKNCDGTTVADNEIAYNTKYGIKTRNTVNVDFINNDVHDNGKGDVKHS